MKVTVELPDEDIREICEISGTSKKGPAIRMLLNDALTLRRRERVSRKFLTGEWSVELEGFESARESDRRKARTLAVQWRD
jgi:hypothetical protein